MPRAARVGDVCLVEASEVLACLPEFRVLLPCGGEMGFELASILGFETDKVPQDFLDVVLMQIGRRVWVCGRLVQALLDGLDSVLEGRLMGLMVVEPFPIECPDGLVLLFR
jgi:hypothetical protein